MARSSALRTSARYSLSALATDNTQQEGSFSPLATTGKGLSMEVETLMKKLDCSYQDALNVLKTDKEIDKGANPFPLSAEQEKVSKAMRGVGRAPTAYKFIKRERKVDLDKKSLIQLFINALLENAVSEKVEILNEEREFSFMHNGCKYKLTLSKPRS